MKNISLQILFTETLENKQSLFFIFILNRESFCVLYVAFQSTICSETSSLPARGWPLLLVLAHLLANERLGNLMPLSITRLQRELKAMALGK